MSATRAFLVAAAAAVVAALAFLLHAAAASALDGRRQVEASHRIRDAAVRVLGDLQDAETGQRGFLLTGDPKYLEPYEAARRRLGHDLAQLGRSASDARRHVARVAQLEELAARKMEVLGDTIARRRRGDREGALAIVRTDVGKRLMDRARAVVSRIEEEEARLLAAHMAAADGRLERFDLVAVLGAVGAIAIVLAIGFALEREASGQRQARRELEARAGELRSSLEDVQQSQSALGSRKRWFRALVENSYELIVVLDETGRATYESASVGRVLGYGAGELVGTTAFELVHPDDRERMQRVFSDALARPGAPIEAEARFRSADGSWRLLRMVGVNLLDHPDVHGVVVNARDVTASRALEEQLRQAQKLDALGRLAAGVAHDFNNLLTAIRGYGDLAGSTLPPDHPAQPDLAEIGAAVDRAAALVRQLLTFSRQQPHRPVALDLDAVVTGVRGLLERLVPKRIRIELALATGLPKVMADPGPLEQVLVNLVVNARDAIEGGGTVRIATSTRELASPEADAAGARPGRYVVLEVADSGVGMPPEVVARIFDPFFTTKPPGEGTGLGLSTVHGIVRQSGGVVQVRSAPGEGATFSVLLPVAEAS